MSVNRFICIVSTLAILILFASISIAGDTASRIFAYRFQPGESLRYRLSADIKGKLPILDSIEPLDITASIKMLYTATPKTHLVDGTMDVELKVSEVELEVEKIPFPIPEDQVKDILNQTVTLAATGEVIRNSNTKPLPFSISIPGVDPKRLYALIFPIVFPKLAIKPGTNWAFKSELLKVENTKPTFTATLIDTRKGVGANLPLSKFAETKGINHSVVMIGEKFEMAVDQNLDEEKKPITNGAAPHRKRTGKITGDGIFVFDQIRGRFVSGDLTIRADITDNLVAANAKADEPKQLTSKVDAKIHIELETKIPSAPAAKQEKP